MNVAGVDIPEGVLVAAAGGVWTAGTGVATYVAARRGRDRRAAESAAKAAAEKSANDTKEAREEARVWRDELRRDRDEAKADRDEAKERVEALEQRVEDLRRAHTDDLALIATTRLELQQTAILLTQRTRAVDAYEHEITILRGENAVMKIKMTDQGLRLVDQELKMGEQYHQIAILRADIAALRDAKRGGRRASDAR